MRNKSILPGLLASVVGVAVTVASMSSALAQAEERQEKFTTRVSTLLPGMVVAVMVVKEGELVKAGQALIKIDPVDYELDVDEAIAAIEIAKAELMALEAKMEMLQANIKIAEERFKNGADTEDSVRRARYELRSTEAAVRGGLAALKAAEVNAERCKVMLSRCVITAPRDGKVTALHVKMGEFAKRGQVVLQLESVE